MIILFAISGLMNSVLAQAPEGIIYQAEARDGLGQPIINQALDVKISIIQDSNNGLVVYEEFHLVTTNDYGMFDLVIGEGTNNLGLLEDVDWGDHIHFLNVQVKKTTELVWINMGSGQLLSVPYALYAKTAENLNNGENDPVFQSSPAYGITSDDITKLSELSGVNTGDQDLSDLASKTDLNNKVDKVAGKDLFPKGTAPGQMKYWNGSEWVNVAPGTTGQVLTFINGVPTWSGMGGGINDVYNPATGKIWMDRNLGASRVATSSTDEAAYGDLYQWGRAADGHESRTSGTTTTLSASDTPGHGNFILSLFGNDWRSPQNDNLWQGISGTNNPCPSGFRLPTEAEWQAELLSWSSNNAAGAFASPLKLPIAGYRSYSRGFLGIEDAIGAYWSSTATGNYSYGLGFDNIYAKMFTDVRMSGASIRCLKEARTTGSKLSVTTTKVTNVKSTTAFAGGEIASGQTYVTARGVCWSTANNPTIDLPTKTLCGTGGGSFTSNISGLKPATTYYMRAYATNSDGTSYGNEVSFTTIAMLSVTTAKVTNVKPTTATAGGGVTANGYTFVTARGVCWSTAKNPTVDLPTKTSGGNGAGSFTNTITGLTPATTYYLRAYATNSDGTTYGDEVSFSTTFIDSRDGNEYSSVTIGDQIWMAVNLKYLPSLSGYPKAYYVYGYNSTNVNDAKATSNYNTYGVLYNWDAAKTACPAGWHLPSVAEWTQLTTYLGGESVAGGKLKETGITHWNSPNQGATNETGFTALPGGLWRITIWEHDPKPEFADIGGMGLWWTDTKSDKSKSMYDAFYFELRSNYSGVGGGEFYDFLGCSVRCVKD